MEWKTIKIAILLGLGLAFASCKNSANDRLSKPLLTAPPKETTSPESSNREEAPQLLGTSSGGGGFADGYAMETLDLAKYSLAQMIKNTSEKVFSNLPEEKGKDWIVNIIENISYKDVNETRYDRPLKFNYDLDTEEIYVTKYFSSTFPYGRFKTRPDKEKMRILNEVILDILHELSHFYGIGNTEETDDTSDVWAHDFLEKGLNETFVCVKEKNHVVIHKPSGMVFRPYRGDTYYEDADELLEENLEEENQDDFELATLLAEQIKWYENSPISFLNIEGDDRESDSISGFDSARFSAMIDMALNNKSADLTRLEKYQITDPWRENGSLNLERISTNYQGVFESGGVGAPGVLSYFDLTEVNSNYSKYTYIWESISSYVNSETKSLPIVTHEVIAVDHSNSSSTHSFEAFGLDSTEGDDQFKNEIRERIDSFKKDILCENQFNLIEVQKYK